MKTVYDYVEDFNKKYPGSVTWWRNKKHAAVIQQHLNPGEKVVFAFAAQKNDNPLDFFFTHVFALTNKRILIGRKRIFFGYFLTSVTPDLFNDLEVCRGLFWGAVRIDTVKELIIFSDISKKGLNAIETNVSEFMIHEKKKYAFRGRNNGE
ncbi:MAG TPA: PH domain-containing protein [Bacilli bacterium]|nr:PH domain-containing protein [Bacilli bacterium]